jgi:phosphonate transport system ATP-binding protein
MSATLQIDGLVKEYVAGRRVLDGLSLSIGSTGLTAVIGPSGTGKSTLLRCINRLVEPTAGRIVFAGQDICPLSGSALRQARRRIGMVFQEYNLVERLTVMENLLSGRLGYVPAWQAWLRRFPRADIDRAFELLDKIGLSGFANRRADALSGGQRQRVGIARALMQQPALLLADEPTSSLDPRTSVEIMELMRDLGREHGIPVIVNMHDVDLARRFAERIVGLAGGQGGLRRPAAGPHRRAPDHHLRRRRLAGMSAAPDVPSVPPPGHREAFRPDWLACRLAAAGAYVVYAVGRLDFSAERFVSGLDNGAKFLARMLPPRIVQPDSLLKGLAESLEIAVLASFAGIVLALPIGLLAARNLMPAWASWPARALIAAARSFHPVIVAIIFVKAVGFGALAGIGALVVASIGFIGKLFAEAIEEISLKQVEAVRATGASLHERAGLRRDAAGVRPLHRLCHLPARLQPAQQHHGGHRRGGRHRRHAVLGLPAFRL